MVKEIAKRPFCDTGVLRKTMIEEEMLGVILGEFHGERCPPYDETFLDEGATAEAEMGARAAGIGGLGK